MPVNFHPQCISFPKPSDVYTCIPKTNIEPKTYTMHHRHTFGSFKWVTVMVHIVSFGYVCLTCWSLETIHSVAVEMITKYHMDTFTSHSLLYSSILPKTKMLRNITDFACRTFKPSRAGLCCAVLCTSMLTKLPWIWCPLKYKRYGLCQSPEPWLLLWLPGTPGARIMLCKQVS